MLGFAGGALEGADIELTLVARSDCVPGRLKGRLAECSRVPTDLPGTRLHIFFAEGSYGDALSPTHDVGTGPPDFIVSYFLFVGEADELCSFT